jgi:hypothetical protein
LEIEGWTIDDRRRAIDRVVIQSTVNNQQSTIDNQGAINNRKSTIIYQQSKIFVESI